MRRKFGNRIICTPEGKFDSRLEYERFRYLRQCEENGQIRNLRRQVEYELLPKQTIKETVHLKTKDKVVEKVAERPCVYIADFDYDKLIFDERDDVQTPCWIRMVEDCKGSLKIVTPDAKIKKKLMLYFFGIEVKYILKATQEI